MTQTQLDSEAPRATLKQKLRHFFAYDRQALRILVACVLGMVSTAIDPPFLALTSDAVQGVLQRTESRAPLIIAVGFLVLAVITLIGGTIGDLFGRRRVLMTGLCALIVANALDVFTIGARNHVPIFILKTISLGIVVPMCVAIVTLTFARSVRPFAYGMLFGAQTLALLVSALLKWIAESTGTLWWSYLPAVVLGVVALWFVHRDVPESNSRQVVRPGTVLLNVALLAVTFVLVFMLLTGGTLLRNWSLVLLALVALAIVMTGRWWMHRLARYFNTDLNNYMFTSRDLVLAIAAGAVISGVQVAFLFEFGTFNRNVQGTGSVEANLRLMPYVLGVLAGSILIQKLTVRYGARRSLAGGMALMAAGLLMLSLIQRTTPFVLVLLPIIALGFGFGVANPARAQVIMSSSPNALAGVSAAIKTATSQLGSAIGITTATVLITQLANATYLAAAQARGASLAVVEQVQQALPDALSQAMESAYSAPAAVIEVVAPGTVPTYTEAWLMGLNQLFLWLGIAMLMGAGAIYIIMVRRAQPPPAAATAEPQNTPVMLNQTDSLP